MGDETGEYADLGALQEEVDGLAGDLGVLDAALRDARQALDRFEVEYRQMITKRLAQVEALQARLAALQGRRDEEAEARAEQAARVAEELTPEERRKSMLRRIHPDRAGDDEEERAAREELTKRLNDAWDRRDFEEFDLIEAEIDRRTAGDEPPEERRRILERVRLRLTQRLANLRSSLEELQCSALWQLLKRAEEAKAEGRNLLAEQANDLDLLAASLQEEIEALEANEAPA